MPHYYLAVFDLKAATLVRFMRQKSMGLGSNPLFAARVMLSFLLLVVLSHARMQHLTQVLIAGTFRVSKGV